MKKFHFNSINSTNDFAKNLLKTSSNPKNYINSIIIADEQTKGKGRQGKYYFSPKGDNIFISFILKAPKELNNPEKITVKSAEILYKIIYEILYKNPPQKSFNFFSLKNELRIKPINDIFYKDKKIVGILTEGVDIYSKGKPDFIILGIGININIDKKIIPDEFKEIIGILSLSKSERKKLLKTLTKNILKNFKSK
ncbi:MAG: hypothetical protein LBD41_04715 [Clostridiales Family XIII bacterium]|jgi:BirA family biotin operon repressor/biotin-[acetyl-CoA-carboxylase] ligase|nr:hypothetical protein [Clostridiales Family XIII bacterium]